ncbi:MAG: NADH-quinone oxidoreductase subunit N [Gammaproteobacteria bacterium]|nr:NADH-quinone oxidoreductase subunit N [Gammaproteobacteria bacterium]
MTSMDILAIAPHLTLTVSILIVMLVVGFWRNHRLTMVLTVLGFVATFIALFPALDASPRAVTPLIQLDSFAAFFNAMFLIIAAVTALISHRYLEGRAGQLEEYYILLAIATLGAMTLASAQHFAAFLLGLEIMSISLYTLIAYPEEGHPPLEAALKYLVLSGVGSTTLLLGMGLIYNATGSLAFAEIFQSNVVGQQSDAWFVAGQALLIVGVAFKLSLIPFHMWTPDVYQGAPAPVTGYLATVSKASVFAILLRFAVQTETLNQDVIFTLVAATAVLSMVFGNVLALLQDSVKRILAYSSIAHMGYLLIGLLAVSALDDSAMALETCLVFLAGYLAMTVTAFAVVTQISSATSDRDTEQVADFAGLFWRRPVLAAGMTIALLSLAGIPLTAGFIAKFYLFAAGVEGALWSLIWAMIIGSAIAIYYYLKIVFAMTSRESEHEYPPVSMLGAATTVVLGVTIIFLGTYPTPLIDAVQRIVEGFG